SFAAPLVPGARELVVRGAIALARGLARVGSYDDVDLIHRRDHPAFHQLAMRAIHLREIRDAKSRRVRLPFDRGHRARVPVIARPHPAARSDQTLRARERLEDLEHRAEIALTGSRTEPAKEALVRFCEPAPDAAKECDVGVVGVEPKGLDALPEDRAMLRQELVENLPDRVRILLLHEAQEPEQRASACFWFVGQTISPLASIRATSSAA